MKDNSLLEFLAFMFSVNITRYLVVAGIFFLLYYVIFRQRWIFKKIQSKFPTRKDYLREIKFSLISMSIFVLVAWVMLRSSVSQFTLRYDLIEAYGWDYWLLSIILMIFIHDTYFYWTHRVMHHPKIYRQIHAIHHKSRNPSPWAAFAFHPIEGVITAGVIVPISLLIPFHSSALMVFLLFMMIYNAYGHLGYELYPKNFNKTIIGKWINTSVSHNQHHQKFNGNYGLYFLFWDRWMGTLRNDYDADFNEINLKKPSN
tara:strand:+ start:174 stop:947 length:774 start_codon:yes stop_codon:yes gene_type:complete